MNQWPKDSTEELRRFYGEIALGADGRPTVAWESRTLVLIPTPFPLRLSWDTSKSVRRVRCHWKVAESLGRILEALLREFPDPESRSAARIDLFGGCYEFRARRGGNRLSLHAWGAAWDMDPAGNPLGQETSLHPRVVREIFAAEGWRSGADFSRPDPMHYEAVRST